MEDLISQEQQPRVQPTDSICELRDELAYLRCMRRAARGGVFEASYDADIKNVKAALALLTDEKVAG